MGKGKLVAAFVAALALAACGNRGVPQGGVAIGTDEFMTDTQIDGAVESNGSFSDNFSWRLQSMVAKAPPHAVAHRVVVTHATDDNSDAIDRVRYDRAADDTATRLKLQPIVTERCSSRDPSCLHEATFAIEVSDDALRSHALTGYRIEVQSRTGESVILPISARAIDVQLLGVDQVIGGITPPSPNAPNLGMIAIATSATAADGPPGILAVVVGPNGAAARAGILPGDLLLSMNGNPLRMPQDAIRLVNALPPSQGLTLELKRGERLYTARFDHALNPLGALVAEADATPAPTPQESDDSTQKTVVGEGAGRRIVAMTDAGGIYAVPVLVNGAITLNFVVDSGASDVSIPSDVASTLMRAGTITKDDFVGSATYVLADGRKRSSKRLRLRSLKVGDIELHDVTASIAPAHGVLLLGQSFLSRFRSWSIDNARHALVIN